MPPTSVHFNGSVNLADGERVMREIATRVRTGLDRIPDGETGDRQHWIQFQLERFWNTPGLERATAGDAPAKDYGVELRSRLAEGADPDSIAWPDLGYARAYGESVEVFRRLRDDGVIPAGVRFQAAYPTPLALINSWVIPRDQRRLESSYTRALFADLARLLAAVPHDEIAIQWDVAVEFGILEVAFAGADQFTFDGVVERLTRNVDEVPGDVPVGLHLCYGDYEHHHFKEPASLELQVRVANAVTARSGRPVGWFAFTVPQDQREPAFFEPLRGLAVSPGTELYFAVVPYHPDEQPKGATQEQVRLVDEHLGDRAWGVCTECGMGRVDRADVPRLLDLHQEFVTPTPEKDGGKEVKEVRSSATRWRPAERGSRH